MRRKAYLFSMCLVFGVVLVACGFTSTPEPTEGAAVVYLPEEARKALDDYIAEVEGPDFEYSVVSAQQATQLEAIHASSSVEQAWCIAIDQTLTLEMAIFEDHRPDGDFHGVVDSWSVDCSVFLAFNRWYHARKQYVWVASPLWYDMKSFQRYWRGENLALALTELGCDNLKTE